MRLVLVAALAACALVAPSAQAIPTVAVADPKLVLVDSSPLTVRGVGFKATERVTVTVTASGSLGSRRLLTRASEVGRFRVRFAPFPRVCGTPTIVRAVGQRGSRASLVLEAAPCVPPPVE